MTTPAPAPKPTMKPTPAPAKPTPAAAPTNPKAPTAPMAPAAPRSTAEPPKPTALHWGLLAAVALLAFGLRVTDTLADPVLATEKPFFEMGKAWDFVHGDGPPTGYALVLAPFALMGTEALYTAARFLPPLLGAAGAVGAFFLARRFVHPAGAVTAALLAAIIPELIVRGSGLFQATLDLAILPWLLLGTLRLADGHPKAAFLAAPMALLLLMSDPAFMALLLPALAVAGAAAGIRVAPKARVALAAAGGLAAAALAWLAVAGPLAPGSVPEPGDVELVAQLSIPALLFGLAGLAVAFLRPSAYGFTALAFTLTMTAAVLSPAAGDPASHVAALGYGIALLAAVPVAAAFRLVGEARPQAQTSTTFGILALSALLTIPAGMGHDDWYRLYDEGELLAYDAVGSHAPPMVVTGSWQAQVGYHGLTGGEVQYNPDFFQDEGIREYELGQHPGLVVLVDGHAREDGIPTGFLDSWERIGQWGTVVAYKAP